MKFFLFSIFAIFALSGCATTQDTYSPRLQTFVGLDESALVSHFGAPSRSHEHSGGKVLQFSRNFGVASFYAYGTLQTVPRYCNTTFNLDKSNTVQSFAWDGNWCN